ncbi:MAG: tRNA 2-thiocytidine(32) synthetase TtcA [Syntrophomonadaceae bacterium]|nr:tRNA 2-thiocytidine(32) synthetase TtcA [Syntrophomonadaceae bacterium]
MEIAKIIFRRIKQANLKYDLVQSGDRIAVGMSGGKDSMILLYALDLLHAYSPLDFELIPISIDEGWNDDWQEITAYCSTLGLPHHIVKTDIGPLIFEVRKESNPCALCSNLRSGAINREASRLGCNKVALGHHLDDAVITLMMSMIFEGQYRTFQPNTYLSRANLTLIRPMIYLDEKIVKDAVAELNLPIKSSSCPASGHTNREKIKKILDQIENTFPSSKRHMLKALENVDINCFWNSEHLF